MLWTSLQGKRITARNLVRRAGLAPGAQVLDIGCGRGLLLIEAARGLADGHAVGIDLWNVADLSGNNRAAAESNARSEGVADRVTLVDGDMRRMPFDDGRFDIVLSSMAVHNIYDVTGRQQALGEILRVLRPGGVVLIQDFRHSAEYAKVFRAAGLSVRRRLVNPLLMFPLTWSIEARRS